MEKLFLIFISSPFSNNSMGLINYWSFTNNYQDSVGGAHLFGGFSYSLAEDRFGNPNSSLSLQNGYMQIPDGVYFDGPFTIAAWVLVRSVQNDSQLLEFGLTSNNQVTLTLPYYSIFEVGLIIENEQKYSLASGGPYSPNNWTHIAASFDSTYSYIYINGCLVSKTILNMPKKVVRTPNYIGKSSASGSLLPDALFDELRIYSGCLTENEINELMNY